MFKPEYILDTVALHGMDFAMETIANKLSRMGKTKRMADIMAYHLVLNTVFQAS